MDVPQSAVPGHGQDDVDSNAESHQSSEDNAEEATATSRKPRDPEGGNSTPSDVMSMLLASNIEDSDENEDTDFFIETEESEDSSSDSDSDLGDRDQPSQRCS
ncbi:hypothetical protein E2C01_097815 [Portunus trituberculatus]|uniref:Uncharacterized protein n=1 Tax=Portunus trituberculatus TaxID=210409 RepID=A0A5B7K6N7_PORTR|nr:hypothetical protein [Portunus trituberculatus]